ncbi:MAG: LytTR family DNA-binding domain-containing protein [Cypionkella sp.]|uniref:LytR/AlgR family response regulator transcription factor n=1 Tax=Cypionkella sp. TaxID=2811411 RepID=UPI002ABC53F5|nr:LytTR family DNA-binding domain-containing protein [Cypionkella sp.]MDZ4310253.1 LytTR family DNA-binding domain-containing protein [Cypionkella sp.]
MTTVLVVDDEPIARRRLIRMLRRLESVLVVGEAADVKQAVAEAERLKPDLLLLDIQIPGGDGFSVLERLGASAPQIIFVTAYDQHALRAFEVEAVDYVTKPVDPVRLTKAIERAILAIAARASSCKVEELTTTVHSLRETLAEVTIPNPALWIRHRSGLLRVEIEDIIYARAERDYVQLHLTEKVCLYPENMAALETKLAPYGFVRIHRSTLVSLKAIQKIQRGVDGRLTLQISDGTRLTVGRTYASGIRNRLSV